MKRLYFLNLVINLWAQGTSSVVNPPPKVEMKEVASSSDDLTYIGFSLPDGSTLAYQVKEPASCKEGIFVPRSASGKQLYNGSVDAAEKIQNGSCGGAAKTVTKSFKNIVWQALGSDLILSSANDTPVDPESLECINGILSPPIEKYETDMGKCSASREIDANIFQGICIIGVLFIAGMCNSHKEIAAAGRRCKEKVRELFSGFPSLLSGRHRRHVSDVKSGDLIPLMNPHSSSSSIQDRLSPHV